MIIVFALLGAAGLTLARQEVQTQARSSRRDVAFYAAETGLARGLENWTTPRGLIPTDTFWLLDKGTLQGGASYQVVARRLDDGSGIQAIYSIRSEGRAPDGQTQRAGLLVATRPREDPFQAALEVKDSIHLAGTAWIEGFDNIPSSWNGPYCAGLDDNKAGSTLPDTSRFSQDGKKKRVDGNPPLDVDVDTTGFFNFADYTYDELAAAADIKLTNGQIMDGGNPSPSLNGDGSCDTSDPMNWGDPTNPGQPCSDWFPIIHATGDLYLQATQRGQGLLLVDGDLWAQGGFEFYGPVIVKGSLNALGGFRFYGGVRATATDLGAGNAEIYYSNCVIQRVLSHARATKAYPLLERPWFAKR